MKYIEIQILTTTEASDAVTEMLYEQGATGVYIEDLNDFKQLNQDTTKWDYVEESFLTALAEDVKVKGYFSEFEFSEEKLHSIELKVGQLDSFGLDKGKGEVSTKTVFDEDWANAWKQYYKPVRVGEKVVIKPTWEDYQKQEGDVIIELDPGMAFGTGTHETTIMCIQLLEKYVQENSTVYDVGCGSGILGITALKLGAKKVLCVDIDEVCVKVANENAELNNVSNEIEIKCGNLLELVTEKTDIIVANIVADIVIAFTDDAEKFLEKGGIFISSGIIKDRRDDVLSKLNQAGYIVNDVLEMGEWCAIAAERK